MSSSIYTEFFGFHERPFTLLPDPDFLYWSNAHRRAFTVLEYGIVSHAPLTVVTGEVGTGKSTLIQVLLQSLGDDVNVGLISNAHGGRGELLRWVMNALDQPIEPGADYVLLFQQFTDYVISEYAAGRHVVLLIDEAQNLSVESLEELRMLTNINSNKDELLQIILVGQPELREKISRQELRQFAQRVSATCYISPMDLDTTRNYIRHRLEHVGGTGEEFTEAAVRRVFEMSGGIPRQINKICELALVYASGAEQRAVDVATVEELRADGLFVETKPVPLYLTNRVDIISKVAE